MQEFIYKENDYINHKDLRDFEDMMLQYDFMPEDIQDCAFHMIPQQNRPKDGKLILERWKSRTTKTRFTGVLVKTNRWRA